MFPGGLADVDAQIRFVKREHGRFHPVLLLEEDQVAGDGRLDVVHLLGIERISPRAVLLRSGPQTATGARGARNRHRARAASYFRIARIARGIPAAWSARRPRNASGAAAARGPRSTGATKTTSAAEAAQNRPRRCGPGADDDGYPLLRQLARHFHGLRDSRVEIAGPGRRQRIDILIGLPGTPRHLDASPSDAQVVQVVLNHRGVRSGILEPEVAAEAVEYLAGMRRVQREFHRVLVDFAGDLQSEAPLDGLACRRFAGDDGHEYLEVVAALPAIVADDDLRRRVERHLDLAARRDEAHTAGGCPDIFVLFGGPGRQGNTVRGWRSRIDELRRAAGELRGGKVHAEKSPGDVGLVLGSELDVNLGRAGAGIFHRFLAGEGPIVAWRGVPVFLLRAHLHRDGLDLPVARVAIRLLLPARARDSRPVRLSHAHTGVQFHQLAVDAYARYVAPGHHLGLAERRAGKASQQADANRCKQVMRSFGRHWDSAAFEYNWWRRRKSPRRAVGGRTPFMPSGAVERYFFVAPGRE